MKKGIVLLAGFILVFSIFLVGCGNGKGDIKASDTNDKSNFKETKKVDFTPKDFKDYYESTSELYISIINSMMDGDKQGVEESNKKLTHQLNEIDKLIANKNIDNPFNDDLNEYLNNLKDLNTSIDGENYDSTPNISSKLGTSVKKLADNNYDGQLPTAVNSFIQQQEENAQSESSTEFGVGDKQTLGGITVTLVSVTKTSERNQFDDTNPKNVVKISYKVENNSGNEYFVNSDIDVYDSNSTIGTRYPLDNTTGKILNGKNINAEYYAGVNENGNIEIVFNLFSDASLTFHAKI
ncbi:hypothetical protein [Listeria ivanovii]|uniref:hypothetical protein n=1 Tax=Listeria ivanovii TaxID=1638 RepID=UPI003CEE778F